MGNPWMAHVKHVKKQNPKLMKTGGLKAILKLAGKTYKKHGKTKSHSKSHKKHKKTRKHRSRKHH